MKLLVVHSHTSDVKGPANRRVCTRKTISNLTWSCDNGPRINAYYWGIIITAYVRNWVTEIMIRSITSFVVNTHIVGT